MSDFGELTPRQRQNAARIYRERTGLEPTERFFEYVSDAMPHTGNVRASAEAATDRIVAQQQRQVGTPTYETFALSRTQHTSYDAATEQQLRQIVAVDPATGAYGIQVQYEDATGWHSTPVIGTNQSMGSRQRMIEKELRDLVRAYGSATPERYRVIFIGHQR